MMKLFYNLLLIVLVFLLALSQLSAQRCSDYPCVITKVKHAFAAKNYRLAFEQLESAEGYPDKDNAEIGALRKRLFSSIEKEKNSAVFARDEAKKQKEIAEEASKLAKRQIRIANNINSYTNYFDSDSTLAFNMLLYNYFRNRDEYSNNMYTDIIKTLRPYRNFFGHPNSNNSSVFSIGFLPNGRQFIASDGGNIIKLWSLDNASIDTFFVGHEKVSSLAVSPDGKKFLSGSNDGSIKLWDLTSGSIEQTFIGHYSRVSELIFLKDGKYFISTSYDGTAKLWSLNNSNVEKIFVSALPFGQLRKIFSAGISNDDSKLAIASEYGVSLWDIKTGNKLNESSGINHDVYTVKFSPDDKRILVGGQSRKLYILNSEDFEICYSNEKTHLNSIFEIAFVPNNNNFFITASADGTLIIWRAALEYGCYSVEQFKKINLCKPLVSAARFSPEGHLLIGHTDGVIRLWDIYSEPEYRFELTDLRGVKDFAVSKDRNQFAILQSGTGNEKITIWDVNNFNMKSSFSLKDLDLNLVSIDYSLSQDSLICIGPNGKLSLSLQDLNFKITRKIISELFFIKESIDENCLKIAVNYNDTLVIFDASSLKVEKKINYRPLNALPIVAFDKEFNSLIVATEPLEKENVDNNIYVWDLNKSKLKYTLKGHNNYIHLMAIASSKRILAAGDGDKFIKLWDLKSGEVIQTFKGHTSPILGLTFSSDGNTLISHDKFSIKFWNLLTLVCEKTFSRFQREISSLKFFEEKKQLVVFGEEGGVVFLNTEEDYLECSIPRFSIYDLKKAGLKLEQEDEFQAIQDSILECKQLQLEEKYLNNWKKSEEYNKHKEELFLWKKNEAKNRMVLDSLTIEIAKRHEEKRKIELLNFDKKNLLERYLNKYRLIEEPSVFYNSQSYDSLKIKEPSDSLPYYYSFKDSIAIIEKNLKTNNQYDSYGEKKLPFFYHMLIRVLIKKKEYALAEKYCNRGLLLNLSNNDRLMFMLNLSDCYLFQNKKKELMDLYRKNTTKIVTDTFSVIDTVAYQEIGTLVKYPFIRICLNRVEKASINHFKPVAIRRYKKYLQELLEIFNAFDLDQ